MKSPLPFLLVALFTLVVTLSTAAATGCLWAIASTLLLKGEVLNQETKERIPYASVDLLGESIGTITKTGQKQLSLRK